MGSVSEFYVVQSGWMVYAVKKDRELIMRRLSVGETVIFEPYQPHNIYLSANSVIHTIKYGSALDNDWFPSPELDKLTKPLDPTGLFTLC